uniref:Aminotransferase n=1 Tax=viral metagenome TaxID=1070528 RepID=A0A6C0CJP1_9ZZZZ
MTRGLGSILRDSMDRKFIDMQQGIGATSALGHSHPNVVQAVQAQASQLTLSQQNCLGDHELFEEFRHKMTNTLHLNRNPGGLKELSEIILDSTGTGAVETAIKLAYKRKPGRVISLQSAFHGRSLFCSTLGNSSASFKANYPRASDVLNLPENTVDGLWKFLNEQTTLDHVSSIVIEPVQGEGGVKALDREFVSMLKDLQSTGKFTLIADEIQSGYGRTGTWWASEHYDLYPDILVFGKAVGAGMPLAGILTTPEMTSHMSYNELGGTYHGNLLALSAAIATNDVMIRDNILDCVETTGRYIGDKLKRISGVYNVSHPFKGMMLSFNVGLPHTLEVCPPDMADKVVEECANSGLLLLTAKGDTPNIKRLRILPAYNISQYEIDKSIEILDRSIRTVAAQGEKPSKPKTS